MREYGPPKHTQEKGVDLAKWLLATVRAQSVPELKLSGQVNTETKVPEIKALYDILTDIDNLKDLLRTGNVGFEQLMVKVREAHGAVIKMERCGFAPTVIQSESSNLQLAIRGLVLDSIALGDTGAALMLTKYLHAFTRCENRPQLFKFMASLSEAYLLDKNTSTPDLKCEPRSYLMRPPKVDLNATADERSASQVLRHTKWMLFDAAGAFWCASFFMFVSYFIWGTKVSLLAFAGWYIWSVYTDITKPSSLVMND